MNKWQFLKRTDLDSYQKLIVMVYLGRYFHWKKWMAEVGEGTIKEIQAKNDWREKVQECFKILAPREVKLLNLRYGLEDGKSRTYEEVGREFYLTRERIRQIEAKILQKLRRPARLRRLGLKEDKQ